MLDETAPYEILTKLEAAERQLRVSIRLFFERRDLVAVHTLAAAAQGVLRDLARRRGFKSIFEGSGFVRPERRKDLDRLFRRTQNFFKHADRDPDAQLQFYYEGTKFYLLDAALLYNQLAGRQPPEITAFVVWIILKFPDLLIDGTFKEQMAALARQVTNPDDFHLLLYLIDQAQTVAHRSGEAKWGTTG